jgi:hypothetical protein
VLTGEIVFPPVFPHQIFLKNSLHRDAILIVFLFRFAWKGKPSLRRSAAADPLGGGTAWVQADN